MSEPLRLLIVEDSEDDALLLLRALERGNYEVTSLRVETADAMKQALTVQAWDLIIADYAMPQFGATAALALLQESGIDLPFIIVSGTVGEDVAVQMMKAGAHDYLMKDNLVRLVPAVERELREAQMRKAKREAEKVLERHVEELERSNAELEQFAYVASHDLQEPLRMVTSYCDLLQRRYAGKLDSNADEFLGYAAEGAQRMSTLVKDLLAYSRISTRTHEREEVDLDAVMGRIERTLSVSIQETGATVTSDALPVVMADPAQVEQLLQHLIGNAIKFHNSQSPTVHVSASQNNGDWIISVADNGIGIDPQFAHKIFVVFQRLHKRNHYPGTGIGLAICKKIVERHGGRIWFESEPGNGSTFYFTIPMLRGGE